MHFARWLEHTTFVSWLSDSEAAYSVCEIMHYFSLFVLVGTVVMVDLRILGLAARRRTARQLAKAFFPWSCAGLLLVSLSGLLMYSTDATDYAWRAATALSAKLITMALAVLISAIVFRGAPDNHLAAGASSRLKILAVMSLLLWIGTIIVAVEIPAVTGVG